MPISISAAQKKSISDGFLDDIGEGKQVRLGITEEVFEQFGEQFLLKLGEVANRKNVVSSGKLLSEASFRITGGKMEIIMPDYFDYPNEGVQGVKSSKNAPGSPYKFKSYGMNAEGRSSIKQYILSGRAKISTVVKTKDKALGIGREKKHLSLIDTQTEQLIYLIKRQGIKATHYFTETLNEVFGNEFELKMSEAIGTDIVFTLEKLNRK